MKLSRRISTTVVFFAVATVVYCALVVAVDRGLTGDEPHYLLTAGSLAHDGDADLTNDYADSTRTDPWYVGLSPAGGQATDYRDDGTLRPLHGVGLPALLAPVVGLTSNLRVVRLVMAVIAAAALAQAVGLAIDLGARRRSAVIAGALVGLGIPIIAFVDQVYPELPAALGVLTATRLLVRRPTIFRLAVVSAIAGYLPWLNPRFGLFTPPVLGVALWTAWRAERDRSAMLAAAITPAVALLGALALVDHHLYGGILPTTEYKYIHRDYRIENLYGFGAGMLFDRVIGLVPYTPVLLFAVAAIPLATRRYGRWAWLALATVAAYWLTMVLPGESVALSPQVVGRVFVILVVLGVVTLALVGDAGRWAVLACLALGAVGVVTGLRSVDDVLEVHATPTTGGTTVLDPIGIWPETFADRARARFGHDLSQSHSSTGRRVQRAGRTVIVAREGRDPAGPLSFGLGRDAYADPEVTVRLTIGDAPPGVAVAKVDVIRIRFQQLRVVASKTVTVDAPTTQTRSVRLTAPTSRIETIEPVVHYLGRGTVTVDAITVRSDPPPRSAIPDGEKVLALIAVTIAVAVGLVLGARRRVSGARRR